MTGKRETISAIAHKRRPKMTESWDKKLACALQCTQCNATLKQDEQRILSVYSHDVICMPCKKKEEKNSNYVEVSKETIGQCLEDSEIAYGDPGGYCFHHFYPFTC